jgi:glycosyltransferase involved in cell wall biosynthesis
MPSQKKICIVGPSKRFISGISYYTIRLANEMSKVYGTSVICFRQLLPTFLFPGKGHVGKKISQLDFEKHVSVFDGMDYNNPITWFKAYSFLKQEAPDVIILQWWTSSVAHMHLLLKIFSKFTIGSKIVIEFHEVVDPFEESILPIRLYSKLMGSLLRNNLAGYITHSESDKKLVSERYAINSDNIYVVPHGLYDQYGEPMDCNEAKENLSIDEEFVVLSFGLIRKYKGIPDLIKAFELLPEEIAFKSRLLIVGEIWEDRDLILETINASKYSSQITIVDEYVPDEMVPVYFSAADVVVLPYTRASQSGIAHIAMSFGKPVVVSKVGGLIDSMKDYSGTYYVEPGNLNAIKEGIIGSLSNSNYHDPPERSWSDVMKIYAGVLSKIE